MRLMHFPIVSVAVAAFAALVWMGDGFRSGEAVSEAALQETVGGQEWNYCLYPYPGENQPYTCFECEAIGASQLWRRCGNETDRFCGCYDYDGYQRACCDNLGDCGGKYTIWSNDTCTASAGIPGEDCVRNFPNAQECGPGEVHNCPDCGE